jgi:hypothetical protein
LAERRICKKLPKEKNKLGSMFTLTISVFSAAIALASLLVNREIAHVANRAYVIVNEIKITTGLTDGDSLGVAASLVNLGHTPAMNVWSHVTVMLDPENFPEEPRVPDNAATDTWSLGPNLPHTIFPPRRTEMYPERLKLILNGKTKLFAYIYISYRDFFKEDHTTTFCATYDPDHRVWVDTGKYSHAN